MLILNKSGYCCCDSVTLAPPAHTEAVKKSTGRVILSPPCFSAGEGSRRLLFVFSEYAAPRRSFSARQIHAVDFFTPSLSLERLTASQECYRCGLIYQESNSVCAVTKSRHLSPRRHFSSRKPVGIKNSGFARAWNSSTSPPPTRPGRAPRLRSRLSSGVRRCDNGGSLSRRAAEACRRRKETILPAPRSQMRPELGDQMAERTRRSRAAVAAVGACL